MKYNTGDFRKCSSATKKKWTMAQNGTDIPFDVAPENTLIYFADKRPMPKLSGEQLEDYLRENSIRLVPLADASETNFAQSYPRVYETARELQGVLKKRPMKFGSGLRSEIPDLMTINIGHGLYSKVQYVDSPTVSGIAFLTLYTQEPESALVSNDQLNFVFQGLTKDGAYYIDARFNISHPSLPKDNEAAAQAEKKPGRAYLTRMEKQLNELADDSFTPSVIHLQGMLQSMEIRKTAGH